MQKMNLTMTSDLSDVYDFNNVLRDTNVYTYTRFDLGCGWKADLLIYKIA